MMIYLMGVMAAQEMKIKKERFADGKKRAKERGKWIGTPVMFGYKIVNQREVINEVAAEVIRKAYKMYAGDINRTAQTNIDIAMYLRNNGICKRSDKFFSARGGCHTFCNLFELNYKISPLIINVLR